MVRGLLSVTVCVVCDARSQFPVWVSGHPPPPHKRKSVSQPDGLSVSRASWLGTRPHPHGTTASSIASGTGQLTATGSPLLSSTDHTLSVSRLALSVTVSLGDRVSAHVSPHVRSRLPGPPLPSSGTRGSHMCVRTRTCTWVRRAHMLHARTRPTYIMHFDHPHERVLTRAYSPVSIFAVGRCPERGLKPRPKGSCACYNL